MTIPGFKRADIVIESGGVAAYEVEEFASDGPTDTFYRLFQLWAAVGAVKQKDSDGTTYSATGAQVTGSGTGTHGLQNSGAWIQLLSPDGVTQVTIQRGGTESEWTVLVYPEGGLSGGNASTAPTGSGGLLSGAATLALLPDAAHTARIAIQGGDRFGWYVIAGTRLLSYRPAPTAPHVRVRWSDDFNAAFPSFNFDECGPDGSDSFEAVERYL